MYHFLVIIAILAVAEAIGKVLFNIVMTVVCVLGVFGIAFLCGKMMAKMIEKVIQYIEKRKNKIKL